MFGLVTQRQLNDAIERLERRNRELIAEWMSWHEKFTTLYARLAKRVKDAQKLEENGDGGHRESESSAAHLSPRAAEIQAQILARRGGSRVSR